jgi:nucleosome binding factor SPN SPT16 subunit
VEPSEEQLQVYALTQRVIQLVIKLLRPGAIFGDIYREVKAKVQEVQPGWVSRFSTCLGHLIGIETADSLAYIKEDSEREVRHCSTFLIFAGFAADAVGAGRKPWSVFIAQTVHVRATGSSQVLTSASSCDIKRAVWDSHDEGDKVEMHADQKAV